MNRRLFIWEYKIVFSVSLRSHIIAVFNIVVKNLQRLMLCVYILNLLIFYDFIISSYAASSGLHCLHISRFGITIKQILTSIFSLNDYAIHPFIGGWNFQDSSLIFHNIKLHIMSVHSCNLICYHILKILIIQITTYYSNNNIKNPGNFPYWYRG